MSKISRYNRRVQFFNTNGFVLDDGGNLVPLWELNRKRWSNVKTILSTETERSGAETASLKIRLAMRYTLEVTNSMCFYVDGVLYDVISSGDPEGLRKETIVIGEAKADGGRN